MANIADMADREMEFGLKNALHNRGKGPVIHAQGFCQNPNCQLDFDADDPLKDKKKYCDQDCASDHARLIRIGRG
jgi:hypothetical protein